MKRDLVLKGYYGRGNLGDEIMLDIFVDYIRKHHPEICLKVMNSNPDDLKERLEILTPKCLITGAGKKYFIPRVLEIIKSDYYIVGGGTILTDKHSAMHLMEYFFEVLVRRILGKKSAFISIGSTEFRHGYTKWLIRGILKNLALCTVRDEKSYIQLTALLDKNTIRKTGDLVYLSSNYFDFKSVDANNSVKKVCYCLMPVYSSLHKSASSDEIVAKKIASVIDDISVKYRVESYLLPIQLGNKNELDLIFSKHVQELCETKVSLIPAYTSEEKLNAIESMDTIISMRLHALLVGVLMQKQIIAIDHNPKITAFMEHHGLENWNVKIDNLDNLEEVYKQLQKMGETDCLKLTAFKQDISDATSNLELMSEILL